MASPIELMIVFFTALAFNLIPFAGPSNLLIASTAAIGLGSVDAVTNIVIGVLIALAASLAKGAHYMITFFVSGRLSKKRQERLQTDAKKIRRWAFPLLFIAAATPIPDEPIVIPLGLMKYSPAKFFAAYFFGKLLISVVGAFLGSWAGGFLEGWLSPEATFALSIGVSVVLTIIVTIILLKVDVDKLAQKYLHRKPPSEQEKQYKPSQETTSDESLCPPKDATH